MIRFFLAFLLIAFELGLGCFGHDHKHEAQEAKSPEDFEAQVRFFQERLKERPSDAASLSKLGVLYLGRARETAVHDDYALAENCFRKLIHLDRESKTGTVGLSYALLGQHRFDEALDLARRSGDRHHGDTQILALMGDIHLALGNYPEADLFFQRLHELEPGFASLTRLAQIAEIHGNPTLAEQRLTESLQLAESQGLPTHQLAWCYTMLGDLQTQGGRLQEADEHYHRALKLEPEMHYADWKLAQLALFEGKPEDAEAHIARALEHGGDKPAYLFTRGRVLLDRGKKEEAERWFSRGERRILGEIVAGDIGHLRELAGHWLDRGEHLESALSLATRDLNEVRHDLEAYELVGWALHLAGRNEEALANMQDALKTGWANSRTLFRAGIVGYKAGAAFQARQWLHQGFQRDGLVDPALRTEAQALADHLQTHPKELLPTLSAAANRGE